MNFILEESGNDNGSYEGFDDDQNNPKDDLDKEDNEEIEDDTPELTAEQLAEIEDMKKMGLPVQFTSTSGRISEKKGKVK